MAHSTNPLTKGKKFVPGKDWVWYAPHARDAYGKEEIKAVENALINGWLTTGPITGKFENEIASLYGKKHGLFVNSGSSANLIALEIMDFPAGSEIITPACTFNTTVSPIIQKGLVPVFVDVKPGYYTLDPKKLAAALSSKTVAVMAPHLIGNLVDLTKIQNFCKKHKLVFIEDSCDTIGAHFMGKKTGKWSDIVTTSFYASHLITTGGAGGMLILNDKKLRERARVFRDWGRGISRHDEKIRSRLATFKIDGKAYDSAFVFVEKGYNMRPTEMQAAFGLAQLARLNSFIKTRAHNYKRLRSFFARYEEHFILPEIEKDAKVNWLAFPLTIRDTSPLDRNSLTRFLEDHKIQTRPLFSGNVLKHPAYDKKIKSRTVGKLTHSNYIMDNALLIGLHHGITEPMLDYMFEVFGSLLKKVLK